jgi:hypothetical protein
MSKIKRKEEASISSTVGSHGSSGEFENPPTNDESTPPSGGGSSEFASPETESGGESSAESKVESQGLIDFKTALEERLAALCTRDATRASSAGDEFENNVVGVGFSSGGEDGVGGIPGQPGVVVFVANEASQEEVRREITDSFAVRAASDDSLPIQVVVTGVIDAYSSNRSRFRPAPAGVSVGHFSITAGTIGGWARGRGSRANRLLMVSNNHVLAASNRGRFGDNILQPGTADGGTNPASRIAILERFVPIAFGAGAVNYVDCATGWCWPDLVRTDHVYHNGSSPVYFRVGPSTAEPRVGMLVGKTGRTTNLTQGRVTATGVSINVNFGAAGVAHFRDQFAVRSVNANPFSAGGDSGSFVWAWDARRAVVGLLFAGGGGTTFCNRINRVIPALDISLI